MPQKTYLLLLQLLQTSFHAFDPCGNNRHVARRLLLLCLFPRISTELQTTHNCGRTYYKVVGCRLKLVTISWRPHVVVSYCSRIVLWPYRNCERPFEAPPSRENSCSRQPNPRLSFDVLLAPGLPSTIYKLFMYVTCDA